MTHKVTPIDKFTIPIRYRTDSGVDGVWTVVVSEAMDETQARAYLLNWHPNYTFLGIGANAPKRTTVTEPRE